MLSIIKRLITYGFILGIILIVGIGYFSQKNNYSTPENDYERVFNQKITKLFDILIGPNQYYVNSTVFLNHKEERSLRYIRTPKSILYEKETRLNSSESTQIKSPELIVKKADESLPGMNDVIKTTQQYKISEKINNKKQSHQEKNHSNKEIIEEIYYDENKFETIKPKHGLERIQILLIINIEALTEAGLTIDNLKDRIQQIIPLKESRGDNLIIEAKMIDFTPPYFKLAKTFLSEAFIKKNITVGFILITIGFILYGILQLFIFLRKRQADSKLDTSNAYKQNSLNEPTNENTVIPLNKKVIKTIENNTDQTKEIVEYWMAQHYAQK